MHSLSIESLRKGLQKKKFSSVELTQYFLQRIQKFHHLNAFITINEQAAIDAAEKADQQIAKGEAKRLTGIPLAHKDIFCTQKMLTTAGSKFLANFIAPYDATIVQKFAEQGAILLGKTNMDEFAMGSSNENSFYGPVKNPWNIAHVPGGSSGGSAAAVAAGLVPFATGSDTGGSIRQPASFCGISGIKPTYGLVSRYGMIAYASSLDQAGPMAKSAEDLAVLLTIMAGFDAKDSTSIEQKTPEYTNSINKPLPSLRIGLPTCFFHSDIDDSIQQAIHDAIHIYQQAGAEIIELDLPLQELWVPCYYVIACAEASSNLARYDGIRYGYRTAHANTLQELITNSRNEAFGMEVKRRILTGTHVLSTGYFDAYYLQAQKIRRLIQKELQQAFTQVDLLIGPTTPTSAFKLKEIITNPVQSYLADVFTVAANLAGIPALSIPVGFKDGLPIGMQLMGNYFEEATLLHAAHYFQQCTNWHQLEKLS